MPAIPQPISGLRALTARNLVLDAGVMWRNPNVATLRDTGLYASAVNSSSTWTDDNGNLVAPSKFGATRGGTTVNINRTERQVDADGRRTDLKGFSRVDMVSVELSTTLLEMGDQFALQTAMGSVDVLNWPSGNAGNGVTDGLDGPEPDDKYQELTPNLIPSDFDYIGTVGIAATISGENQPVFLIIENCKVVGNVALPFADKNEMAIKVDLRGHALLSDPLKIPMHVYVPIEFQS